MFPKLNRYKILALEKMDMENGSMREMSVGGKKETWKCSLALSMLHADMCPFAAYVMEKEGITSSRRTVQFLLIALPLVSLLLTLSEGFLCDALDTKLCCLSYFHGEH